MSDRIQPTSSQNPQNTAVENQSVGQFGNQVIAKKDDACIKGLHEKVRCGFSLGRSIGRVWRAVKEGVGAFFNGIGTFFKKHFGGQSEAPTVQVQVGMGHVSAGKIASFVGSQQPSGVIGSSTQTMCQTEKPTETTVPPKPKVSHNTEVSIPKTSVNDRQSVSPKTTVHEGDLPKPTISQALSSPKEKRQDVLGGSAQPTSIPSKSLNTAESNASPVSPQPSSATSSTQSTASVKKNVSSSSPKYRLVDVPGNGNCGIYAVLVGMGAINPSEFGKPTHPDQGQHPLANAVQEQKVGELRKKSAEIAHKALGSRYSLEELKNMNEKKLSNKEKKIKNLLEMGSSVSEDNMKFVTEAIQKPIMVHVFQGNFCSKTLFEVGKDGQYWDNVYGNEVYPEIKASEDTIHLYLSNGHYQLMSPIKAP